MGNWTRSVENRCTQLRTRRPSSSGCHAGCPERACLTPASNSATPSPLAGWAGEGSNSPPSSRPDSFSNRDGNESAGIQF
ncbi:MAG: hypothetical protein ACLQVD_14680, partial [Capsulimonadaceae bacterium]